MTLILYPVLCRRTAAVLKLISVPIFYLKLLNKPSTYLLLWMDTFLLVCSCWVLLLFLLAFLCCWCRKEILGKY